MEENYGEWVTQENYVEKMFEFSNLPEINRFIEGIEGISEEMDISPEVFEKSGCRVVVRLSDSDFHQVSTAKLDFTNKVNQLYNSTH